MDKATIIGQLELDINALQRQVEEFKKHSEKITKIEWELFVQRLQLMHDYSRQLQMNADQETVTETKQQPIMMPVTVPMPHESEAPKVKVPHIVAKEQVEEKAAEAPPTVVEIKEVIEVKDKQAEVIAHISAAAPETKPTSQKKKTTVSV